MSQCWKIAHRGASGQAPENTFTAFDLALAQGADAIEFDIQCTQDGIPVVFHDVTLTRMAQTDGVIAEMTLAELQRHTIGGQPIPTFAELLEHYAHHAVLITEIKTDRALDPVAALITQYASRVGYERLPVISFNADWPLAVKQRDPHILIGSTSPMEGDIPEGFSAGAKAQGFWSINPCLTHLTRTRVEEAQSLGLKVLGWTANSAEQIARAKQLGVDGIMSDYPDRL